MARTEHEEQVAVIKWCEAMEAQYPELRWIFAVPNGGKLPYHRNPNTGATFSPQLNYLKAEGLRPGVSDLFLPCPNETYCGLFVEMKRKGDKQPSKEQAEFIEDMLAYGYFACVCHGFDEAIEAILNYVSNGTRSNEVDYD